VTVFVFQNVLVAGHGDGAISLGLGNGDPVLNYICLTPFCPNFRIEVFHFYVDGALYISVFLSSLRTKPAFDQRSVADQGEIDARKIER
jgi:hypothetical protein